MLTEYRYGALSVVQNVSDKDLFQRRLRQLDRRLFVECQRTFDHEDVWCICLNVGETESPWTIHEHRDPDGVPIPYLTDSLIDEIQRRMQRGAVDIRKLDAEGEKIRAKRDAEHEEQMEDIRRDFERRKTTLSPIQRSRGLQMSRDRGGRGPIGPEL